MPAAVTMTALSAGLLVAWVVLAVTMPAAVPSDDASPAQLLTGLPLVTMAVTAFLLTARRPTNPVGWLLGVSVLVLALLFVGTDYGDHWLYVHDLPAAWVVPLELASSMGWAAGFPMLLVVLPMVFPDGHLLSRRWRPLVWLTAALVVMAVAATVFDPASIGDGHRHIANPLGVPGAHDILSFLSVGVDTAGFVGLMAVGVLSVAIRYRRADSELRQQLKLVCRGCLGCGCGDAVGICDQLLPARIRGDNDWVHRAAGEHRDRGPEVPALRNRRCHQSHRAIRDNGRFHHCRLPRHRGRDRIIGRQNRTIEPVPLGGGNSNCRSGVPACGRSRPAPRQPIGLRSTGNAIRGLV